MHGVYLSKPVLLSVGEQSITVTYISTSDVDECTVFEPCHNNATCINNNGSYLCYCKDGWQGQQCQKGRKCGLIVGMLYWYDFVVPFEN